MTTRRLSASSSAPDWTKLVTKAPTKKIGARFRLRKLYLRQLEFSRDESEFIIEYLERETTMKSQSWWMALSAHERTEVAGRMKLYSVRKDEEQIICLSSVEATKCCILIHGRAEAHPIDRALAPFLKFEEGAVVGNLSLPARFGTSADEDIQYGAPSAAKWRSLKREKTLQSSPQHYKKVVVLGPADFLMLQSTDVIETISRVVDRVERDSWAKAFGLEHFAGCLRCMTFEPGACLAIEGQQSDALYLIVQGECRASISRHSQTPTPSPLPARTTAMERTLREHCFKLIDDQELPVASLGPKSSVGEISLTLGIPEPVTVRALTTVNVLALSRADFARESSAERSEIEAAASTNQLRVVAYDTLAFVLGRVEFEAKHEQCDQTLTIASLRSALRENESVCSAAIRALSAQQPRNGPSACVPDRVVAPLGNITPVPPLVSIVQDHSHRIAALGLASSNPIEPRVCDPFAGDSVPMTKQQLKAAREFSSLQFPVAAKSMASSCATLPSDDRQEKQSENQSGRNGAGMFLVPTMTRQRQLHTQKLPLLPRYHQNKS